MVTLDRKVVRDLLHMRGQALAIALVISSGAATYIMSVSTLDTLMATRAAFYRDYRFAEVFGQLKRAPESLRERIAEIPGVQHVETRVLAAANLSIEGFSEPASAQIVSVRDSGPSLNRLFLRTGRLPDPLRDNEVVVSEAFAQAHGFELGERVAAIINGRRRQLVIVGIALSPEFIFQIQPGGMIPDFKTFGIFWMSEEPLEAAYNMEGAFNSVTLTLTRDAVEQDVIDRLDLLLARYGGQGAYGRTDQISHRYLSDEFRSLQQMATVFPLIFYGVAAFLLNVVVTRLIATQREQVAVLKAFGYTTFNIVEHYLKLIVVIVMAGVAGGIGLGTWMGRGMSGMYMEFYRFPFLIYSVKPSVFAIAALVSTVAAVLGTVFSVYNAAKLPPAVAMQPPAPPKYKKSLLERFPIAQKLAQPTRMIVRNIERRPLKSLFAIIGSAMACAILVMGGFFNNAFDYMVTIQLKLAQKDDLTVTFIEPTSKKALYSLASLRGVEYVEPFRAVPVRLRYEHRSERTSIQGIAANSQMRRLLNDKLEAMDVPPIGLLLTDHLAKTLGVVPGDLLTVEVLEGQRRTLQAPLAATIKEFIGVSAYMRLDALNAIMREGPSISGAYLQTDSAYDEEIYSELREMPRVAGAAVRANVLRNFYDTMAKQALTFAFFNTILAGCIAFGVVYNSARIAFAERSRELASLRVLGLTRGEVSYILLGELALLTLAAIPLGFYIGRWLAVFMVAGFQTDLYRIPLIIEPRTYAFAAIVVLVSAVVSALMIQRKINRLDLVEVLKTKE
jgi:putative ABC transport system permease protein